MTSQSRPASTPVPRDLTEASKFPFGSRCDSSSQLVGALNMARYDLTEAEWRLIEPLLPNKPRGVARVDDRRVINGIFYVLRTGSPWRDLPERYGPYTTVYNRYNRWAKGRCLAADLRDPGGEVASVDAADRQLRSSGPTSTPPAEKRGPGSRHRPFSWRTEHQDPRRRRPGRPAGADHPHRRPSLGHDRRAAAAGRAARPDHGRRRPRLRLPTPSST